MTLALILLACQEASTTDKPVETDTDTDTDSDSDTDTDTDTDADADADTDADTDTGTTIACTGVASELEPFAEARDDTGPCTACNAGNIELYAGIRNPCPMDISVELVEDCFVKSYSISYPSGIGVGAVSECEPDFTLVDIPAGGVYEQLYHDERLEDPGAYSSEAELFTSPSEQVVNVNFQIL